MEKNIQNSVEKGILILDRLSSIPVLTITVAFFVFSMQYAINLSNFINFGLIYLLGGLIGTIIYHYDRKHISPKVKTRQYDDVTVDAICCLFYGAGIFILVKGLAIAFIIGFNHDLKKQRTICL